jgi:acetolactate synthase-1/2/3 large subunit
MTNVAEVLVQCLEHAGVELIFGIPGGPLTPVYEALSKSTKIRPILSRHEEGAAFMANGYARVSRKLGVCCVTSGPGGTHALTAIAASFADSVPVLIISAQISTGNFGGGAAQDGSPFSIDIVQIFKPATKFSGMLANPSRMQDLVQRAIRIALTGRHGPVHINLPADLAKQPSVFIPTKRSEYRVENEAVDLKAIKKAIALMMEAKHPCILVGSGTLSANATQLLINFGTRTGIPIATTPKAKGAFPENHELSLGVLGLSGHAHAEAYFNSPALDALMVIGSSLGETVTYNWREGWSAPTIHVDIDPQEIGKNFPVTIGIIGDAGVVLLHALQELDVSHPYAVTSKSHSLTHLRLREFKSSIPRYNVEPHAAWDTKPLKPQRMIRQLRECLPSDALFFMDIGNCMMWAGHIFEVSTPGTYFVNLGFGSMGHSVAAAIGAQLATANQRVFVLTGDAAFAMNGMEVHSAVENQLPVTWIVMNNSGHGMVSQGEKVLCGRTVSPSTFAHRINFALLAVALGASGHKAETEEELKQAIESSIRSSQPTVIDVWIDQDEIPPALSQRADALKKAFASGKKRPNPQKLRMPGLPS